MRSVDRMMDEQRRKKKRFSIHDDDPDDMELTMPFPTLSAMNQMESVFDRNASKNRGGINTAPSVFSKGAVFRVTPPGEE